MQQRINGDDFLKDYNIVDILSRHVSLHKKGAEYYGICPFHADTEESLKVNPNKQVYKCFACGAGGDAIDFLTRGGMKFHDAIDHIKNDGGAVIKPTEQCAVSKPKQEWTCVPAERPATSFKHFKHGNPSKVWEYKTPDGALIGYVCRFDLPDGTKQVLPYNYATNGSRTEWRWLGLPKPRPLYNLHLLKANPDAPVLIVEGEKTADAIAALIPANKLVVVTWMGGADGIRAADFTPLKHRLIIQWPDNDEPGERAMHAIADIWSDFHKGEMPQPKWVKNPLDAPKHWDAADANWTAAELWGYIRDNRSERPAKPAPAPKPTPAPAPPPQRIEQAPPPPPPPQMYDGPQHPYEQDGGNEDRTEGFFRFLGFDKTEAGQLAYYFYGNGSNKVVKLTPSNMGSRASYLQLAPLMYWEKEFPTKSQFDVNSAANFLINVSHNHGIFSTDKIRGRGAWMDKGAVVIHAGNKLVVDGRQRHLKEHKSKFIYELAEELEIDVRNPLPKSEANKLVQILKMLSWERDINAYLLAGWCVIAPVCGALKWRPHIWITGSSGTGKTWVLKNFVVRLLGASGLLVQSETSEAGLRQRLGHDAMPVVFDEAEAEDRKATERMQQVLNLMRAASAEDGGIMLKGSASHVSKSFRIRSCFAFASISIPIAQQSDRTRVTILGLVQNQKREGAKERWQELLKLYNDTVNDDYVQRLQARTIAMLPIILKNTETFANAAAAELGYQRAGDQLGALLAGAYSLHSDGEITYDAAVEWIRSRDLSEERQLDKSKDEIGLVSYLFDQITRIEGEHKTVERTIGELVKVASGYLTTDPDVNIDQAHNRLCRLGFKVSGGRVLVSNSAGQIKSMLRDTAWSRNWNKILKRIDGAEAVDSTRFASGLETRAVSLPLSIFKWDEPEGGQRRMAFDASTDDDVPF